jgi:hypothetical protein
MYKSTDQDRGKGATEQNRKVKMKEAIPACRVSWGTAMRMQSGRTLILIWLGDACRVLRNPY